MSLLKQGAKVIVCSPFVIVCLTWGVRFFESAGTVPMLFITVLLTKSSNVPIKQCVPFTFS